ncbi:hypothetical conserved protein [Oceanobacillus iheyensis HTE831]|uniref:Hypothetical conserved protein n=1 Tax=Oceanobacillus iheyensis (strain DSM 14371 / CIP 107618 / JCM 11309 / KCTC 3954 / HTE831) TaxID=221109 RepID=Q8ERP9_OCEIH|nr:DUF2975 domain-containing protein [Oceanobacillus iheyensis]BAC13208.1 hypothetical conserved protein [Oceanobacillus iheyensis HTE831]
MERRTTPFLKSAVFILGITVLILCMFWLPWLANVTTEMYPEFSYLQYPVLIGLYVTAIPFFVALYQILKLLKYIHNRNAFSVLCVGTLKNIKKCAVTISILYVIGSFFLMSQDALHPGIAIISSIIIFTSIVIAVFTSLLQKLLINALNIKIENDLTV